MSGSGTSPHSTHGEAGSDPSMEDILASIRRILNEDEVAPASPAAPGPHPPAPVQSGMPNAGGSGADDGVLVLDEAMLVPMPDHAGTTAGPAAAPAGPEKLPAEPMAAAPVHVPAPAAPAAGLMGQDSAAATAASVGSLLRQLSTERGTQVHRGGADHRGPGARGAAPVAGCVARRASPPAGRTSGPPGDRARRQPCGVLTGIPAPCPERSNARKILLLSPRSKPRCIKRGSGTARSPPTRTAPRDHSPS